MSYLELNDRVELSSIYADTSNMDPGQFYINNNSLTGSIDKTYLNPPFLTNTVNNPIYIKGVNQQTNKTILEHWNNYASINSINFGTSSEWDYGYYRIYVIQYNNNYSYGGMPAGTSSFDYYDLTKKPIYWNKSPLQFMTYIDSGSFEIGGDVNNKLNIPVAIALNRNLITISKPFFIQRTVITCNFFNKVVNHISSSIYNTYTFSGKDMHTNIVRNYFMLKRYHNDKFEYRKNSTNQDTYIYPSNENLSSITGDYNVQHNQTGYSTNTITLTPEILNEVPCYLLNSIGKTAENGTNVYATKSFAEHYMDLGYTPDNTNCILNNNGWHWNIPTECQWEYACRAGTSTFFNNGVNFSKNPTYNSQQDSIDEIAWWQNHRGYSNGNNAASLKPNKLGLYDMHGLMHEWVKDHDGMNYNLISGSEYTPDISYTGSYAGSPVHLRGSTNYYSLRGGYYGSGGQTWDTEFQLSSCYRYIYTFGFAYVFTSRLTLVQP